MTLSHLPPLRLINLNLISLGLIFVIFTPLIKLDSPKTPQVKSATFNRLTVPFPDDTPVASVSAKAVYIYDVESKSLLYQKNSHQKLHPASLTKLMTAIITLNTYEPDQILKIKSAPNIIGSSIHLSAGESMSVGNLLNAALIASGNDAAFTLAENDPEGYNAFLSKMNQKAKELRLFDTNFTNVTGVEDKLHHSTARDLTILAAEAIKNPIISQIVSIRETTVSNIDSTKQYFLKSTNELLGQNGVIGIKTGTTPNAGENLITLVNQNGHPVIITILNSKSRFTDTQKLISWVFTHHTWKQI
jgi:serine-type D-Ala-D-Ala carboxypeptidase (penicillin-binding protein 5/6)